MQVAARRAEAAAEAEAEEAAAAAEAGKEAAQTALETALSTEDVAVLQRSAEASWVDERDAERLRVRALRVCEEAAQRDLRRKREQIRAMQDTAELREVGLQAVRTAGTDTFRAMAVHAAELGGVDVNTRVAAAAAGEEPLESRLSAAAQGGSVETVRALAAAAR